MEGGCRAADSPTVSVNAMKQGRWDKARKMRGHLVGSVGWTLDSDGDIHSPLLFLLADTFPNNLLDFRIHDLVVTGWLHSLRKRKCKQSAKDTVLMRNNDEGTTEERVYADVFVKLHLKSYVLRITRSHPAGLSTLTERGSCGQPESRLRWSPKTTKSIQRNLPSYRGIIVGISSCRAQNTSYSLMHDFHLNSQTQHLWVHWWVWMLTLFHLTEQAASLSLVLVPNVALSYTIITADSSNIRVFLLLWNIQSKWTDSEQVDYVAGSLW